MTPSWSGDFKARLLLVGHGGEKGDGKATLRGAVREFGRRGRVRTPACRFGDDTER